MSSAVMRTSALSTPFGGWGWSLSRSACMPQLIKGRAVVEDRWTLLRDASSLAAVPIDGPVIVPLALWQSEHQALSARGDVGVWLKPDDDPATLESDIGRLPLIAIDFPKFVDVRGYSSGRLLRE